MLSHNHEIFLEVARLLSFTKASQTLFLSQSAISKQVKTLETYYQAGLFNRSGNQVSLTSAGQLLYNKLLVAKQLQHDLHREFKEANKNFSPAAHLLLGASTTISLYFLPPVLSAYLQHNPSTQITLKNRNSANIITALLEHEIDLGIVEGNNKLNTVTYSPFLLDEVIAVCSHKSPWKNSNLEIKDLLRVPLGLRESGSGTLSVLETELLKYHIKLTDLSVRVRLGGTEALKNFVLVDTCVAFLPRQAVLKELKSGELVEVTIKDLFLRRTFNFIQRKGSENNWPYKDFIQFTKKRYS